MASAAVRAREGVSRWEKSFFVGVGRVEDDAVVAPVHLAMRAIFISLCHARLVIRCFGGRALAGLLHLQLRSCAGWVAQAAVG